MGWGTLLIVLISDRGALIAAMALGVYPQVPPSETVAYPKSTSRLETASEGAQVTSLIAPFERSISDPQLDARGACRHAATPLRPV